MKSRHPRGSRAPRVPKTAAAGCDRRERLWPLAELANALLDRTPKSAQRRCSRGLSALAAQRLFALSQEDIAVGFGVARQLLSRDMAAARDGLRLEAARQGQCATLDPAASEAECA